ncbi:MAG: hypothetical protein ONB48_16650 [candidate division KSB1 bacterium]|nr:hypothetical protein [candidate division KSB1 bacterium]MDZ7274197.1 hypothetical protein [candidate division KSB1 bacterium]MDZ7287281.1 hypothetical protein [candidate division KSB1 bacterium]MDZ7296795.1 hypothetical protein [candidate division KSB1 bacterium]MDZ7347661.1 hypothetical protein [candidate division KSB1 bacterium]
MRTLPVQTSPQQNHAAFHPDFIWVALAAAQFAGFALGAHVAAVIGFDFPLGPGFYSFIQVHGHVQLVSWAGLFIIGISLHFLPRLAGMPLTKPQWRARILWLLTAGLLLRTLGQCLLPYVQESAWQTPLAWAVVVSGVLEWAGILAYAGLLWGTMQRAVQTGPRPALEQVKPFFLMMLAGWNLYAVINAALLFHMAVQRLVVVQQAWNEFAMQTYIGLVLLPVAFAFSVRMFPLYLRLPAVTWPVRRLAYAYVISLGLQLLALLPPLAALPTPAPMLLSAAGGIARGAVILIFVWQLDLLTRWRLPWTAKRVFHPGPQRPATRPGLPDYGEFGRFERLVYAAYSWLVLGALLDLLSGASKIFDFSLTHSSDASRHVYLLGFITLLIFGMSVRMLPGFLQKKRVWSPRLVSATFWLGNLAVVLRVMPLLVPMAVFEALPVIAVVTQAAFGLSGIVGLTALACLTINLMKTL